MEEVAGECGGGTREVCGVAVVVDVEAVVAIEARARSSPPPPVLPSALDPVNSSKSILLQSIRLRFVYPDEEATGPGRGDCSAADWRRYCARTASTS